MQILDIKRTLDEIKALYQLEPSLRDLYVEGINDLCIISWFLAKKGKSQISVFPIELIEIPIESFRKAKLSSHSNRNKVIVLSEELCQHFSNVKIIVKCIVDADFDRYLDRCRKNYILQYTDYNSFEMYLFNVETVEKFLSLALTRFPISASEFLNNLKDILQRIFIIRLANEKLNWHMKWIDIKNYIVWKGKTIEFDESRFLTSYLQNNGRLKYISKFRAIMDHFNQKLHKDSRHNIRGHDFTDLFFLATRRYSRYRGRFGNIATFEGALRGCLELDVIENEPLFVKLATF